MKHLIVGGVAGGATAAARLRRLTENDEIILFEKGEYISYANCGLPYYIGDTINNREKLFVQTAKGFTDRFRIDIRTEQEVTAIRPDKKEVEIKNLSTGETYTETYDKLVLSPGAEPLRPSIEGIGSKKIFTLRNVPDTDTIKNYCCGWRLYRTGNGGKSVRLRYPGRRGGNGQPSDGSFGLLDGSNRAPATDR